MTPPATTYSSLVLIRICRYINATVLVIISLFVFLIPCVVTMHELADPNIRSAGIPASAWTLHRDLSPQFEKWARDRLNSSRAAELSTNNNSGTEWPLFGSVF